MTDIAGVMDRSALTHGELVEEIERLEKRIRGFEYASKGLKQTENALESSELSYRRLFESAKDGILIIGYDSGIILDVNQFLIDLLGYSKSEFIKKYVWEVGGIIDVLASKDKFLELKNKEYVRYEDLPLQTKTGKTIDVEFVSNVYLVNNAKTIQCNIRDITVRKQSEVKLRVAKKMTDEINQAKADFLMNVSHDIRTPLNVISGFTTFLMKTQLNEDQKQFCEMINKKVADLLRLVENIIDISAVEKGKVQLRRKYFNIRDTAEDIQKTCKMQMGNKQIEFKYRIAEDVPRALLGDAGRLKQILENLCGNAVKFTEKGAIELMVSAEEAPGEGPFSVIHFRVEDTGRGILAEQLPYIFEPYSRFYELGQKIAGVGLGLHIVKTLVTEMGGEVTVSSEVGKGSKFSFKLRMMSSDNEGDPVAVFKNPIADKIDTDEGLSGMNILVAEDDEDTTELMKLVFKDIGCYIQFSSDGTKVLDEIKKKKYDLVFMDLRMPLLDGFQTTEAIRNGIDKNIPIIALTAHGMEQLENKCKEAGMNGYIRKPLNVDKIKKTIKQFLNPTRR